MTNIVAIVQARTGSTRLPEKILLELSGKPMLVHDIERIRRAKKIDDIIVATTTLPEDDRIVELCLTENCGFFRGSGNDVLDRYFQASREVDADVIIRITSDCPLIDPDIIDKVIENLFLTAPMYDYSSNIFPVRTFPRGLDTEVFSFSALEKAWQNESRPDLREHVTQYIIRHPDDFSTINFENSIDLSHLRWTVDTPEDFLFVQQVYEHFPDNTFSWREVLNFLSRKPDLSSINSGIRQKEII